MKEHSFKPYLINAIYQFLVDCVEVIHIDVRIDDKCIVPVSSKNKQTEVFSIGPNACQRLEITSDGISFHGRFNTLPFRVLIPLNNVRAIYAPKIPCMFSEPFTDYIISGFNEAPASVEVPKTTKKPNPLTIVK